MDKTLSKENNIINFPEAKYKLAVKQLLTETEPNFPKNELLRVLECFGVCIDKQMFMKTATEDYYIQIINGLLKLLLISTDAMSGKQFKEIYQPKIDNRLNKEEESFQVQLFDTSIYDRLGPEDLREDVANTNNKAGYLGVTKKGNKYIATIWDSRLQEKGRKHAQQFLGSYANPIQAAQIRDQAALYLHGDKAKLNFPISD